MSEFLLVHGSCHGAWCWRDVIPALSELGHSVRAIDLPGHGEDKTPVQDITLDLYADAVLEASGPDTIIVGHSMAGFPIAAAAEKDPARVGRLVFLCAYAPLDGLSLADMRKRAPRQPLMDVLRISDDGLTWFVEDQHLGATFYHDCPKARLITRGPACGLKRSNHKQRRSRWVATTQPWPNPTSAAQTTAPSRPNTRSQ